MQEMWNSVEVEGQEAQLIINILYIIKRLFIITSEALMYCKGPGQDECTIREVL